MLSIAWPQCLAMGRPPFLVLDLDCFGPIVGADRRKRLLLAEGDSFGKLHRLQFGVVRHVTYTRVVCPEAKIVIGSHGRLLLRECPNAYRFYGETGVSEIRR